MASHHLLNMENKRYSGALGTFLMGGNSNFTGYLDASNSVAVNSIDALSCNRRVFGMENDGFACFITEQSTVEASLFVK